MNVVELYCITRTRMMEMLFLPSTRYKSTLLLAILKNNFYNVLKDYYAYRFELNKRVFNTYCGNIFRDRIGTESKLNVALTAEFKKKYQEIIAYCHFIIVKTKYVIQMENTKNCAILTKLTYPSIRDSLKEKKLSLARDVDVLIAKLNAPSHTAHKTGTPHLVVTERLEQFIDESVARKKQIVLMYISDNVGIERCKQNINDAVFSHNLYTDEDFAQNLLDVISSPIIDIQKWSTVIRSCRYNLHFFSILCRLLVLLQEMYMEKKHVYYTHFEAVNLYDQYCRVKKREGYRIAYDYLEELYKLQAVIIWNPFTHVLMHFDNIKKTTRKTFKKVAKRL